MGGAISRRIVSAVRFSIGVMFLVFVGMFVTGWSPPEVSPAATAFREQLLAAGYIFPTVYLVYLLVGGACVTGRFVPLAAVLLFPVTLNIFLYHLFLVPEKLALTAFLLVPNAFLLWISRGAYRQLLKARPD